MLLLLSLLCFAPIFTLGQNSCGRKSSFKRNTVIEHCVIGCLELLDKNVTKEICEVSKITKPRPPRMTTTTIPPTTTSQPPPAPTIPTSPTPPPTFKATPSTESPGPCPHIFQPTAEGSKFKIFCYFEPNDLDASDSFRMADMLKNKFCTHMLISPIIFYNGKQKIFGTYDNETRALMTLLPDFRKAGLKVLLNVGDWWDWSGKSKPSIGPYEFSTICSDPESLNQLAKLTADVAIKMQLDGINFRWIYPGIPWAFSPGGSAADADNFITLLAKLRQELNGTKMIMSSEIQREGLSKAPDERIQKYVEYLLLYPQEYSISSSPTINYYAPMNSARDTVLYHVNYLKQNRSKLLIGVRQTVRLFDYFNQQKTFAPLIGLPNNVASMKNIPWLAFMKKVRKERWNIDYTTSNTQAYASNGLMWSTYEDPEYLVHMTKMVKELNLAGMFVRYPFDDDYRNAVGCGKNPFMRTINEYMRGEPIKCRMNTKCP